MPRDPSQDSVLHAAPQLGVWTAFILPPHRAERSGPVSSARCVQVFHRCFKSCWWGLWAGFFQAICGPFAARDNKSQRTWLTGRWAWRKNQYDSHSEKLSKAEALTRPVLNMLSLTGSWVGISCLIKATLASNNSSCRLTMLSVKREDSDFSPARPGSLVCRPLESFRLKPWIFSPYTDPDLVSRRFRLHLQSWRNMPHQCQARAASQWSLIRAQLLGTLPWDDMVSLPRNPCCLHTWPVILFIILCRTAWLWWTDKNMWKRNGWATQSHESI